MSETRKVSKRKLAAGYRVSSLVTNEAVGSFLSGLDCPRSLAVWMLFSNGEHSQLLALGTRAEDYASPRDFRDAYCATNLLSKADFLETGIDKRAVALEKFYECEAVCADTNRRFRNLAKDPLFTGPSVWLLNAVRRKIETFLGGSPFREGEDDGFCPVEWFESCSWGPGSSTLVKGVDTSSEAKFQREVGITRDLHYLVGPLLPKAFPLWGEHLSSLGCQSNGCLKFEVGNQVLTVPKNAKTDRVIAAEPGLNCFFQLGLGTMIRRRLLRHGGIDLLSQERNGLLAFYASMSGKLATVDFSSASDCISTEVCRAVLPSRWFSVLDSCRSKFGELDGKRFIYEKFSSMGNGFTFPLQSLLFLAVACSVCEYLGVSSDYVGVFGDDVVIPSETYASFVAACTFFGFRINHGKSHSTGRFRESCGVHYCDGVDVKPIFLKERLHDLGSVYRFANAIRRLANRHTGGFGCRLSFHSAWSYLRKRVPKNLRFPIPEGYGDGGFVEDFDEAAPQIKKAKHQIEGYYYTSVTEAGLERESFDIGLYLSRLFKLDQNRSLGLLFRQRADGSLDPYRLDDLASGNQYSVRRITRLRITRSLAPRWVGLGGWV